mgnify:CR=1 FL=1
MKDKPAAKTERKSEHDLVLSDKGMPLGIYRKREQVCPECGKRSLLPATREQRKSFVREQTALLRPKTS